MDIAVLGGGISGITTATTLHLLGYNTTLITAARLDTGLGLQAPQCASAYPAASVIPHAVRIPHEAFHLQQSQRCFDCFRDAPEWGVRVQRHAELFEFPTDRPSYAAGLRNPKWFEQDAQPLDRLPQRRNAPGPYGWTFDMTFVEAPRYLRELYALYEQIGGTVQRMHIRPDNRSTLPGDVWVNCLGYAAPQVFDDPAPATYRHGFLLHVAPPADAAIPPQTESVASYNYALQPNAYPTPSGNGGGIYFYPRSDVWIVGGTKHPAHADGTYQASLCEPTRRVHGVVLPAAMWYTNVRFIRKLTGVDIQARLLRVVSGLRYLRDPEGEGVRLSWEENQERPIMHNYGHGGAGVTLSWSCALQVARVLREKGHMPALPMVSCETASALQQTLVTKREATPQATVTGNTEMD